MVHAIELYVAARKWWVDLFVVMPDHWHAIVSFENRANMSAVLRDWKRFVARQCGVKWQDGYFDHRLRSIRRLDETWDYMMQNPVKQNLVPTADEWPYVWAAGERAALGRR